MPGPARKLPKVLTDARQAYRRLKVAHGYCGVIACTRPVRPGKTTCEKCGARYAAATKRYTNKQILAEEAKEA